MTTHSQNLPCDSLGIPSGRVTQDLQYFIGVWRKQPSPRVVNNNREKHLHAKAQIPTGCGIGKSSSCICPWIDYAEHFKEQKGQCPSCWPGCFYQPVPGSSGMYQVPARPQAPGGLKDGCSDPVCSPSQLGLFFFHFWYCQKEMFEVLLSCTGLLVPSCHLRKGSWSLWLQNHYGVTQLPAVISWCCGADPRQQQQPVIRAPEWIMHHLCLWADCFVCAKRWLNV